MTTQTLITCNGKINQHGFCDKCYQLAPTTSNQCGRLVPYQQAGINMVLAVSGQNESIQRLAALYLAKQFIDYGDQNEQAEQQILQAFTAGFQAACASGAVDTVAARVLSKHVCGAQGYNPMLGDTCEACENERKSSEGQP